MLDGSGAGETAVNVTPLAPPKLYPNMLDVLDSSFRSAGQIQPPNDPAEPPVLFMQK